MSIRFSQRLFILSSTRYTPGKPLDLHWRMAIETDGDEIPGNCDHLHARSDRVSPGRHMGLGIGLLGKRIVGRGRYDERVLDRVGARRCRQHADEGDGPDETRSLHDLGTSLQTASAVGMTFNRERKGRSRHPRAMGSCARQRLSRSEPSRTSRQRVPGLTGFPTLRWWLQISFSLPVVPAGSVPRWHGSFPTPTRASSISVGVR